jgi:MoaA/NifB/PqqE/SkfB family radical SAM enzyme
MLALINKILFNQVKGNPLFVIPIITYKCNAKCKMCEIWNIYKENPFLVKKEINLKYFLNFFKCINSTFFCEVLGGEPFLRKGLDKFLIRVFKETKNDYIGISTNGFLNKRIFSQIKSVLSRAEKVEKLLFKLQELKEVYSNFKVFIVYTFSYFNIGHFKEFEEYVSKLPYDVIIPLFSYYVPEYYHNFSYGKFFKMLRKKEKILKKELIEFENSKILKKDYLSKFFAKSCIYWILKKQRKIGCKAGKNFIVIDPFGNVKPCFRSKIIFGNLLYSNFKEIERNRKKFDSTNCNCNLFLHPFENLIASPFSYFLSRLDFLVKNSFKDNVQKKFKTQKKIISSKGIPFL